MNGIEIREYRGDFQDVADLVQRAFGATHLGKKLFPLYDAAFLSWQLGSGSEALLPAAYDGNRLVGTLFSIPHTVRIGSKTCSIGICSWFAVDPEHQRSDLGLRLTEAVRQRQGERGLVCSLVVTMGDLPFRSRYLRAHPGAYALLFKLGLWVKMLVPRKLATAATEPAPRLLSRAVGPLLGIIPQPHHAHVRLYRAGDLQSCALLLEKAGAAFDWALVWSIERLARQLASRVSNTLVLERDSRLQGLINYHFITVQGHEPIRAAMIDLWADGNLSNMERARFLGHFCQELRTRNIELIMAARSAMMPAAAFAANLFIPTPREFHVGSILTQGAEPLPEPKTWSLLIR